MGKRTSDFLALATVVSGAGLGIGLTGLALRQAEDPNHDESSVTVQVLHDDVELSEQAYMQALVRYRQSGVESDQITVRTSPRRP